MPADGSAGLGSQTCLRQVEQADLNRRSRFGGLQGLSNIAFLSVSVLVSIGFLGIQSMHDRLLECGLGMAVRHKYQIVWCVC
jgi:hypothetical protein